ncbi:uncharacterized protein C8Q71DRAFT_721234 [Rhodofomes roseus]|uniref:Uncharacterized protein n=1 Tax=Rhodofomes roseus TaxID=34475 RepID=A0ABQ8KQP1_9APHY|nr:uncharacterized protein C8Q71DRAFT_721234 [Rhodofomes roseus]KAH9840748.1 hypothetical protein C8Q71DRAFT_721234 [Rhodofomes roseus]
MHQASANRVRSPRPAVPHGGARLPFKVESTSYLCALQMLADFLNQLDADAAATEVYHQRSSERQDYSSTTPVRPATSDTSVPRLSLGAEGRGESGVPTRPTIAGSFLLRHVYIREYEPMFACHVLLSLDTEARLVTSPESAGTSIRAHVDTNQAQKWRGHRSPYGATSSADSSTRRTPQNIGSEIGPQQGGYEIIRVSLRTDRRRTALARQRFESEKSSSISSSFVPLLLPSHNVRMLWQANPEGNGVLTMFRTTGLSKRTRIAAQQCKTNTRSATRPPRSQAKEFVCDTHRSCRVRGRQRQTPGFPGVQFRRSTKFYTSETVPADRLETILLGYSRHHRRLSGVWYAPERMYLSRSFPLPSPHPVLHDTRPASHDGMRFALLSTDVIYTHVMMGVIHCAAIISPITTNYHRNAVNYIQVASRLSRRHAPKEHTKIRGHWSMDTLTMHVVPMFPSNSKKPRPCGSLTRPPRADHEPGFSQATSVYHIERRGQSGLGQT